MRFVKSLLLLIYLLSSLPVLASYHYCLGRVKQITFYEAVYDDCVCPEPEAARDCCDDEQQLLDFQDDHAGTSTVIPVHQVWETIPACAVWEPVQVKAVDLFNPRAHGPPPLAGNQSLYIVHQSFLL